MNIFGTILTDWTPAMPSWEWRIEIDELDGWWLTQAGSRRNREPWQPSDEIDAFAAVTLLYMLNEAGPVPLPAGIIARARYPDGVRTRFKMRAYSIFVRHLIR